MKDYRPDVIFVVSGEIWRDFCALREAWGHPLTVGLSDECITYVRRAIRAGDTAKAAHWRAVRDLATQYGLSWISAVEVDGTLIQEEPEHSIFRYPPLSKRKRVVIDGRNPVSI